MHWLFRPEPSGCQDVPFHRAMLLAATPPAVVKVPPAISSWLYTPRLVTRPLVPVPSARHDAPSHAAMCAAGRPPAVVNEPPTTSNGPIGEFQTVTAHAVSLKPSGCGEGIGPERQSSHWAAAEPVTPVINASTAVDQSRFFA